MDVTQQALAKIGELTLKNDALEASLREAIADRDQARADYDQLAEQVKPSGEA